LSAYHAAVGKDCFNQHFLIGGHFAFHSLPRIYFSCRVIVPPCLSALKAVLLFLYTYAALAVGTYLGHKVYSGSVSICVLQYSFKFGFCDMRKLADKGVYYRVVEFLKLFVVHFAESDGFRAK